MIVIVYYCQSPCKRHFAIEKLDLDFIPVCPICKNSENVLIKENLLDEDSKETHQIYDKEYVEYLGSSHETSLLLARMIGELEYIFMNKECQYNVDEKILEATNTMKKYYDKLGEGWELEFGNKETT